MIAAVQPVVDALSVIAWTSLMLVALVLARRLDAGRRSAWMLVGVCCGVVALDKALDVQSAVYTLGQRTLGALDPHLGLGEHRALVRVVLVVPLLAGAVVGALVLALTRRSWGSAERLGLLGLTLILVYVGLRLLPGMAQLVDSSADKVFELTALVVIASGERVAWRRRIGAPPQL